MTRRQHEPCDRRCTALASSTGERCRRWAIAGGTVCPKHGGGAPQVRAAAKRRLERERLDGDLAELLEELEVDARSMHPIEMLLDAVHRTHAMVVVLGTLVGSLSADPTAKVDGVGAASYGTRLWGPDHLGDGAPHVLLDEYGRWLERSARASKLALDAGVDERRVQMAEQIGEQIAAVLQSSIGDAMAIVRRALGPGDRERAEAIEAKVTAELPTIVRRHIDAQQMQVTEELRREAKVDAEREAGRLRRAPS